MKILLRHTKEITRHKRKLLVNKDKTKCNTSWNQVLKKIQNQKKSQHEV